MINALEEIEEEFNLDDLALMFKGAQIRYSGELMVFEENELEKFVNYLAYVNYDNGYGCQYLDGFVLLEEGWLERRAYDGREWWQEVRRPTLRDQDW